jgi:hypothetical protein
MNQDNAFKGFMLLLFGIAIIIAIIHLGQLMRNSSKPQTPSDPGINMLHFEGWKFLSIETGSTATGKTIPSVTVITAPWGERWVSFVTPTSTTVLPSQVKP